MTGRRQEARGKRRRFRQVNLPLMERTVAALKTVMASMGERDDFDEVPEAEIREAITAIEALPPYLFDRHAVTYRGLCEARDRFDVSRP